MRGTENIGITKHAIEQFRNRILYNPLSNKERITTMIRNIFCESRYVSDNSSGILFRHDSLRIEFIVKDKKIITLYQLKRAKRNGRNRKNNR